MTAIFLYLLSHLFESIFDFFVCSCCFDGVRKVVMDFFALEEKDGQRSLALSQTVMIKS